VRIAALIVACLLVAPAGASARRREPSHPKPTWTFKVTVDAHPVARPGEIYAQLDGAYHVELTGHLKYHGYEHVDEQAVMRGSIDSAKFSFQNSARQCLRSDEPVSCDSDHQAGNEDLTMTASADGSLIKPVPLEGQLALGPRKWGLGLGIHDTSRSAWREMKAESHARNEQNIWRQCLRDDAPSYLHQRTETIDNDSYRSQTEDTRCPETIPDEPPPSCPAGNTECSPPPT